MTQDVRRSLVGGFTLAVLSLGVLTTASPAWAAEPAVEVIAEQVHASDSGTGVDDALAPMKQAFTQAGLHFSSFHRLSRDRLSLRKGQAVEVKLATGRTATLRLKDVQHGTAQIVVSLAPVETTYSLGREGSVFIQAGPHNGGMLILVLSPVQR